MGRRKPHRIMWKAARKENIIARRKKTAVRHRKAAEKAAKKSA